MNYTIKNGYRLPNLLPPQDEHPGFGKYALLRLKFLKQHRKITFTNLLTLGKLNQHLEEVEKSALSRKEQLIRQMSKSEGITEKLKAEDQMKWVQKMNSIHIAAEEIVLRELIYD